ncbi:AaceriAEL317Cp [[Ashbya] aceris (nom. inval.)]|nr:AaceriAEL317Cp [[Ashbya] aceris (nom. inval.)]
MSLVKNSTHLLLYSFAFGGTAFYSYVFSPIAFKTVDRETFSTIQNRMLELVFKMQTVAPIVLGLTAPYPLATPTLATLLPATATGAVNLFWLLPWTRRVKRERREAAKHLSGDELEAVDAPLRKEFGRSHGLSLLFNMLHTASLLAYGVFLSKRLFKYVRRV